MTGFKPRASQLAQQQHAFGTAMHPVSEELTGPDWKPEARSSFSFKASEVEVYAVLSVAQPGDAAWMLSKGVRSAEAALAYLRDHGAEHRTLQRTIITGEALRRGIASKEFISRLKMAAIAHPVDGADLRVMDVMELSTIRSLDEQWGWVIADVMNGAIRLEDIKYLGASKLKSFRRLVGVKDALRAVHEPDAVFSMEDLKYLVDKAARDSLKDIDFTPLAEYLVAEGVAEIKKLDSLKLLRKITNSYYLDEHKFQRITYELKFRRVYERQPGVSYPQKELIELFDAGVDAEKAAEMMSDGLSVVSVIGVLAGGVERSLADGWL